MEREIKEINGVIQFAKSFETCDINQIKLFFDEALSRSEEGIVIKDSNSEYKVNERGMAWVKLKADYLEGFTDTLDLVIIGGWYCEGM